MTKWGLWLSTFILLLTLGCGLTQEQTAKREEYLTRARYYYINKKYRNAWHQIEKALEIDPENKRALIAKGWALFYLQKYDMADEAFQKVFLADSSDPWLQHGLGSIAFKKGSLLESKMLKIQKQIAENVKLGKKKLVESYQQDLDRYEKERQMWYKRSLEHYEKSQAVNPGNWELHKLIAMVYVAQGMEHYPTALTKLSRYIRYLEEEGVLWHKEIEINKEQRKKMGITNKEKEEIDVRLEKLETENKESQEKYRIAQGLAAELYFQMAAQKKQKWQESQNAKEKQKLLDEMHSYTQESRKRVNLILKSAPHLASQYRNLANIAKLEGNNDLAIKYLQEYIKRYPLENSTERVRVKQEIKRLKAQKN